MRVGPVRLSIQSCSALHILTDRESERGEDGGEERGWECNPEGVEKAQENGRVDLALDDAT